MNQVNVAVIGAGRMGAVHARNLVRAIPEAHVVAVCDTRLDAAHAIAGELGIARVAADYHDLLADKTIAAVLIATSTDTHAEIIQEAARAGKHIFCEKPLALDLATIDDALAAVNQAGVQLQVGFNRRFDASFRRVHDIVASGELGRPCLLKITSRDPAPPSLDYARGSGGIFLDMTIHDFDMARYQMGEVDQVYATGGVLVAPQLGAIDDLDTAIITLKFSSGAIGVIDNSRQAVYGYDQRLEVHCAHGVALAENPSEDTVVKGQGDGYHSSRLHHFFMSRYAPCYVDQVRAFIACVRDDQPTPTTGEDGRRAVVLGHAAWKAYRENRPVALSEFGIERM